MNKGSLPGAPKAEGGAAPIGLDGLAWGVDFLDAILVVGLADAHLHAAWAHPDAGLRPEDLAGTVRDAYRVVQFAARRLGGTSIGGTSIGGTAVTPRGELLSPQLTIELPRRVAVLRRIRAHVVACVFDAAMPLGLARLVSTRLANELEPELPLHLDHGAPPIAEAPLPPRMPTAPTVEEPPTTLSFGSARPRRTLAPPRPSSIELDRIRRLLAHLEAHAPEPHTARLRLALRAGLTLVALDHPEALGPEALVLIESAVEEILGLDRTELRRIA